MRIWRKGYRKLLLSFFVACLFLSWIYLRSLNKFAPEKRAENFHDAATVCLLGLAGIAAFWTARETFNQKKVSQKQLDYSLRPYLRIQLNDSPHPIFDVANDGNGVALDVRFEETKFRDDETDKLVSFKIKNRPLVSAHGSTTVSPREVLGADLPVGAPNL